METFTGERIPGGSGLLVDMHTGEGDTQGHAARSSRGHEGQW
jgi:SHS family lactate transporter-like MFS transporter